MARRRWRACLWTGLVGSLLTACGDAATQPQAGAPRSSASQTQGGQMAEESAIWPQLLGHFLNRGPTSGTWAVQGPSLEWTWHFAPHPARPTEEVLAAQVRPDGSLESVASLSRRRTPLFFYEAPGWVFAAYYEVSGPAVEDTLHGTPALRVHWRPKYDTGHLTGRVAWFKKSDHTLLQIEDRSRAGVPVRRVRRVLDSTISFSEEDMVARTEVCCPAVPDVAADDLSRLGDAPFPVMLPTFLPPGYMRIRADYDDGPVAPGAPVVQRATVLYSDGMGLISLAIGPADHMDAIARHYSRMPARQGNSDVCPELPAPPENLVRKKGVVRLREETCRVVLRLDEVADDLSVMLIARKELPTESYLRMLESLKPMAPIDVPAADDYTTEKKQK